MVLLSFSVLLDGNVFWTYAMPSSSSLEEFDNAELGLSAIFL